MASFNTQRSLMRRMVLSQNQQATIGEVMADAELIYTPRADTSAFFNYHQENETDRGYAKGSSFASENRLIAETTDGMISGRVDDFLAAWLLAFCMRDYTFTAGVGGAPNTHLMKWKDTSDPALLTNVYIEDTTALKRKWSDIAITSVVLTGADKGSITYKANCLGLGLVTDGAMAALPALPSSQYLYGSDATVSIGPVGAPVSKTPRVMSWEATFDHADTVWRGAGVGTKGAFIRQGDALNKLKLVIANDGSADLRDWHKNRTPLEVKIAIVSGAASLTIDYLNVILPDADLGEQDKIVATTINLDETCILQGAGGQPVTATVLNTQTAYLVAL